MLEHGGEEEHGEGCPGLAGEELHAGGAAPTRAQVSLLFLAALLLQNPRQTQTAGLRVEQKSFLLPGHLELPHHNRVKKEKGSEQTSLSRRWVRALRQQGEGP